MGPNGREERVMAETWQIGPRMKEPGVVMGGFFSRERFPSLLSYWQYWHMGKERWGVLCAMAAETRSTVRFSVPGFGVVGGFVPYFEGES